MNNIIIILQSFVYTFQWTVITHTVLAYSGACQLACNKAVIKLQMEIELGMVVWDTRHYLPQHDNPHF